MKPISICIPTYNRADKLAQCLEHLCTFEDQDFEVVVGNNASDDDTDRIVVQYANRLQHFTYLRHATNLGFSRNMDSILRRASREYVYILSDDDFVFENALDLALGLMHRDSEVVAVVGSYYSLRQLDPHLSVSFENAVVTTIAHKAYAALLGNLGLCDGHPIMRRSVFQRHCAYLDRTALIPLYFRLITLGKVLAVDRPFFQHRTTNESLSSRMADAWFLDLANADLELAVRQAEGYLPADALEHARKSLLHTLYFQAVRMSISRNEPYALWLFLNRLSGIGGLSDDVAVLCEYHFTHDILIGRVRRELHDAQIRRVRVVANSLCASLAKQLNVDLSVFDTPWLALIQPVESEMVWLDDWPAERDGTGLAGVFTLADILAQVRLTKVPCQVVFNGERMSLQYLQPHVNEVLLRPNKSFEALCSPYSET